MSLWILLLSSFLFFQIHKVSASDDYYSYTVDNFRQNPLFHDVIDLSNPDYKKLNAILFYLTNEIRVRNNLSILLYEKKLEESAAIHSLSMVEYKFFDHINPKSKKLRNPEDRARYVGIVNPYLAENIMETFVLQYKAGLPVYTGEKGIFRYNQGDKPIQPHTYLSLGETLMEGWMNSPRHKENILLQKAVQLGCGTAFYLQKEFNDMPAVIATQNFQLYEIAMTEP